MKQVTSFLLMLFWHYGGIGLLVLGILDSSFLFAPLGNDLLVVVATAHYHSVLRMLYYAAMSTVGSVLGCLLVDLVFRRAGEKGLEKHLSGKRLDYVKRKVTKDAPWALVLASIAPPPFPFTPFIMAASALQYSRKRMLILVGAARMVRFTGLGVLALFVGKRIIQFAKSPVAQGLVIGLIVISVVGSIVSVVGWVRRSRRKDQGGASAGKQPEPAEHAS
jgi:membrane protein YqaA with SNARE-associated domain